MKKLIWTVLFLALTVVSALAWKGAWYTCVPTQCSQTVIYFDTWEECNQYRSAMGSSYKPCTPYR